MTRAALILASLIGLSGCDAGTTAVLAGAGLATFVHTDKTVTDHAVSWATEEDCALLHAANAEPYCQARPEPRARMTETTAASHCYRTLGTVTCYDRPDRAASHEVRVDHAHGFTPPAAPAPVAIRPEGAIH